MHDPLWRHLLPLFTDVKLVNLVPAIEFKFFGPLQGLRVTEGRVFFIFFLGFAIDRSKKYIKIIKNYIKIDAVDLQAAADNPPPGNNG